jgi:hypothetical protein
MSALVKSCIGDLRLIARTKIHQLKALFEGSADSLVNAISEIALNVVREIIPFAHTKRQNNILKILANKSISVARKRKLILSAKKFIKQIVLEALNYLDYGEEVSAGSRKLVD